MENLDCRYNEREIRVDVLLPDSLPDNVKSTMDELAELANTERGWEIRIVNLETGIPYLKVLEGNVLPDIVLAVGKPVFSKIAKEVFRGKQGILVISCIYESIASNIKNGFGGYDALFFADAHIVVSYEIGEEYRTFLPNAILFTTRLQELVKPVDPAESLLDIKKAIYFDLLAKLDACIYGRDKLVFIEGNKQLYMDDKISIIVPVYNAEKYIEAMLKSLLRQKIPLYMLEIIIVDDSSDNSFYIAKQLEQDFPDNIILIKNEVNRGAGIARNIGMKYASGNMLAFVDADDLVYPTMFRTLYERLVLFGCDFTGCGFEVERDDRIEITEYNEESLYITDNLYDRKKYLLEQLWKSCVWRHLYRKDYLEYLGLTFPSASMSEDMYFQEICVLFAKRDYECSDPLYRYRIYPENTAKKTNPEKFKIACDVQEAVYQAVFPTGVLQGVEKEFELVYYLKSYLYYISEMKRLGLFDADANDFKEICDRICTNFPEIIRNPYLLTDESPDNRSAVEYLSERIIFGEKE